MYLEKYEFDVCVCEKEHTSNQFKQVKRLCEIWIVISEIIIYELKHFFRVGPKKNFS